MIQWSVANITSLGAVIAYFQLWPITNLNFNVFVVTCIAITLISVAGKLSIAYGPAKNINDLKPKLYLAFISLKLLFTMSLFLVLIYKFGKVEMRETVLSCTAFYGFILIQDVFAIVSSSKSNN